MGTYRYGRRIDRGMQLSSGAIFVVSRGVFYSQCVNLFLSEESVALQYDIVRRVYNGACIPVHCLDKGYEPLNQIEKMFAYQATVQGIKSEQRCGLNCAVVLQLRCSAP